MRLHEHFRDTGDGTEVGVDLERQTTVLRDLEAALPFTISPAKSSSLAANLMW
jgi:hypothetical protein